MLLNDFNEEVTERVLTFLWRQWVQIGANVSFRVDERDGWIVDPEALWLLTASVGREEPRLFDTAMDWIAENASYVNISRLRSLIRQYQFESERAVAAMASVVCSQNKRLKWRFSDGLTTDSKEDLFVGGGGRWALNDPFFTSYGFCRGVAELRSTARRFNPVMPECALLRLRALIGLNARAEIYAYLCTHPAGHPSGIAREIGYSQKNVQDILVDMEAGRIVHAGQLIGRKKSYWINSSDHNLLLYNPVQPPAWITWAPIFRVLEILWTRGRGMAEKDFSPLMLSGKFRELSELIAPLLDGCGQGNWTRSAEPFSGEAYAEAFMQNVLKWLDEILQ